MTADLRELFLFTDLTDAQLDWIREHGETIEVGDGEIVNAEGEQARCFYVLLSGTLQMTRLVAGDQVEIVRTDQRGVYFGATQFYLGDQVDQTYAASVRALSDCRFLTLPDQGIANANALVGQRERLLALGKLSAGLTHELNNPAAAAGRAADTLRERLAGMRHKLAMLAEGRLDREALRTLTVLQERFVELGRSAPALTALQTGDLEDQLADWLDDHDVAQGWDLAPVFVAGRL